MLCIYYGFNVIFTWILVGAFYLIFAVITRYAFTDKEDHETLWSIGNIVTNVYIVMLAIVFILSLGVKPSYSEKMYHTASAIFAVYMTVAFIFICYYSVSSDDDAVLLFLFALVMGVFAMASALYCCIIDIVKGYIQFIMMTPTYVNIFIIYAICNIHDVTWGSRADTLTADEIKMQDEF